MLQYDYSLFYLGKPVLTPIGMVEFKKIADYGDTMRHLSILQQTDKTYLMRLLIKTNNQKVAELIRNEPFLDSMMLLSQTPMYKQYEEALMYFFGTNLIDKDNIKIYTDEELYDYLELIYHMNAVGFPKRLTGDKDIDRFIEFEKRLAKNKNKNLTFESIFSSVCMWMGKTVEELESLTLYQLYANFYRISQYKSFDVTTMYRLMDGKIKQIEWNAHVDILGMINKQEKNLDEVNNEGQELFT